MNPMLSRAAATQACMDRFAFKPVEPGVRDCRDLGAHALHKQGRSARLLNGWRGKTWASALRYVRRSGFANLMAGAALHEHLLARGGVLRPRRTNKRNKGERGDHSRLHGIPRTAEG